MSGPTAPPASGPEVQTSSLPTPSLATFSQPTLFLDEAWLPRWLGVQHGPVELYAQPFQDGRASDSRHFLAVLPKGAIFPQQLQQPLPQPLQQPLQQPLPHSYWRLCVVVQNAGALDAVEWPDHPDTGQATLPRLNPLIKALSQAGLPAPALATLAPGTDPWPLLQQWLQDGLNLMNRQQQPLPLAEIAAANLAARQSAMRKMARVLNPAIHADSGEQAGLAGLASKVAHAQGLPLFKGSNLPVPGESLQDWAGRAGVRLRRVALRDQWWQSAGVPLLAIPAQKQDTSPGAAARGSSSTVSGSSNAPENVHQVIALLPTRQDGYTWHDQQRATPLVTPALAATLSSFAYSLHGRLPERALHLRDLLGFGWRAALNDVMWLLLAALASGLLGAISPVAVAYVFKTVIPSGELPLLASLTSLIALVAIVSGLLHLSADLAALRIEGRLGNGLQSAMFDRLLRLPLRFYSNLTSGDLANRIAVTDTVRRSFSSMIVQITTAFFYTLGAFTTMVYFMPKAALLAAAIMLLVWGVTALVGWRQVKTLYEGEQIEGNIIAMLVQLLQGITKLRLSGAEDRGFGLWGRGFAEMRTRQTRSRKLQMHLTAFVACAEVALPTAIFATLGYGSGEKPSTSEFLALVAALATFSSSGMSVGQAIARLIMLKPFFERIRPILDASPEAASLGHDVGHLNGAIEVSHLSFGYQPEAAPVLRNISFQVKPGQFVAIVGSSGCGKSTLFRLLLGFEKPDSGGIYYDGRDFQSINPASLRRHIGVVLQNGRAMPGTLFENISVAHDCTLDQAWQAARQAGLSDDIRAMPMGMHTMLSEGSSTLSGGQLQRLLLARALAGQPDILLLDEATSALDNRTQAWVTSSLGALAMTRLVIAHRLSTVQQADLILVLHDGDIVERGTYAELMGFDGHFARLAKRQLT